MNQIKVVPVSDGSGLKDFLKLPWRIQKNDPCWVPPILSEQKRMLDRKRGPFFELGEVQLFLALRGSEPVGRISAHINHRYDEIHDSNTGFFGFFECVEDRAVSSALFDAAAEWLKARGRSRILGPESFSIYDDIGILVKGFDSLPAFLQGHNPPYYESLLLDWGFRKAIDWYAIRIMAQDPGIDRAGMKKRLDRIMRGQNLVLRPPLANELVERAGEVCELFNDMWSDNWGHIPLTEHQFRDIFVQLKPIMRTRTIRLLLDGNDIVGFIVNIPDINPAIQKCNGRLYPWDMLRLLWAGRFGPLRKVRTLIMGVRRSHQRRNLHHALILSSYLENVTDRNLEVIDCSLISEPLEHLLRAIEVLFCNAERYKIFRIFEREI